MLSGALSGASIASTSVTLLPHLCYLFSACLGCGTMAPQSSIYPPLRLPFFTACSLPKAWYRFENVSV